MQQACKGLQALPQFLCILQTKEDVYWHCGGSPGGKKGMGVFSVLPPPGLQIGSRSGRGQEGNGGGGTTDPFQIGFAPPILPN